MGREIADAAERSPLADLGRPLKSAGTLRGPIGVLRDPMGTLRGARGRKPGWGIVDNAPLPETKGETLVSQCESARAPIRRDERRCPRQSLYLRL